MEYDVEYTDDFESWWHTLSIDEQESVTAIVGLLEKLGTNLPYPYSSAIKGKGSEKLRELRIQCHGNKYRILYAFDPRRAAILLLGGCKSGNKRWYLENIPRAKQLLKDHLEQLKKEEPNGKKI